jgi:hypothetical protein
VLHCIDIPNLENNVGLLYTCDKNDLFWLTILWELNTPGNILRHILAFAAWIRGFALWFQRYILWQTLDAVVS